MAMTSLNSDAKKPRCMCKRMGKPAYTYDDVRKHASKNDAWMVINGKVYDITEFANRHPGGEIIYYGLGIDSTILFETHHAMVPNRKGVYAMLEKYYIGDLQNYHQVARFDTPFAKTLLERCRAYVHKRTEDTWWIGRRWDALSSFAILSFFVAFFSLVYKVSTTGSFIYGTLLAIVMAVGHLLGHAANHYSLTEYSIVSKAISMFCTNTWGLREQYWTFGHLLSHHCYNYAERDYMLEQHVPTRYFRIRPEDPYKPLHKYQHYFYLLSPAMAFFIGALRWDCAPWVFVAPVATPVLSLLGMVRNGHASAPAPQFTAAGSTHSEADLKPNEDGVGLGGKYVVRESSFDVAISLIVANVVFLPMFIVLTQSFGLRHAVLLMSFVFGLQSAIVIRSLLLQHLSEDIILKPLMTPKDDWYAMQVEASTSIKAPFLKRLFIYGIGYQIEHHMFPCMSPQLLHEVKPIVEKTAAEFGVKYHGFETQAEAQSSVYKRFKKLSVPPKRKAN